MAIHPLWSWSPAAESPTLALIAPSAARLPLAARLRRAGWAVRPVSPESLTAPPASIARAIADHLAAAAPDIVVGLCPPWWLGVAAQTRAAGLEDPPARWLLAPPPESRAERPTDHAATLERAALDRLARAAADAVDDPPTAPHAVALSVETNGRLAAWREAGPPAQHPAAPPVSLGVVMVHRDRPALLARALTSLEAQTRPPDALVVVDAASTDPASVQGARAAVAAVRTGPARLLALDTASLGAARAAGADGLETDWLLFMDDDNLVPPEALATFARAAATGAADLWTCWARLFPDEEPPPKGPPVTAPLYAPLGPVPGLMDRTNDMGDAHLLIHRAAFTRLGGFDPDPNTGAEDWDLLVRAWTAGLRHRVIPRVLLWKRQSPGSMSATMDPARARARIVERLRAVGVPL
ncbi:glycosyltransferase family 2 protein [Roseospira navarrensis]|uniref:Glycosyltransferase n=1 Tax=Roseospira navarrensis TaxID=140058 RepID=A0A7X1ZCD1_9PROT|nr:glycosyltransferase [Roseospira navarrensis]MQX35968.1 glycosyltransferase [Roseospira navarrensis]